jgi:hypothetical protein
MYKSPPWRGRGLRVHTSIICVHTSIPTYAYTYVSHRYTKEVKSPRGRFQGGFRAHNWGGGGVGEQVRNGT